MPPRFGPSPAEFLWASGIEDTFVPQTKPGHRPLDEYQLLGHYDHWREDLALARDLGVRALRWGVPWHRVEPQPKEFDWRWTDQVIPYLVEELGIAPIIDLVHYGCPFWLRREFASEDYPRAVARYAREFARRYQGLVRWYTPLNEPIVNALMCGKRGLWPPYLRGERGYIRVMLQLVEGVMNTVEAIREVQPDALMVHVEATGLSRAARHDLEALAVEEQRRGYLAYDLLTGRMTPDHPLFPWLVRNGISPDHLSTLAQRPITLDVMGMNFYPQWSTQQLYVDRKGRFASRPVVHEHLDFSALIEDYWDRYGVPILITETSAVGSDELRAQWLAASLRAIRTLRGKGVPVIGYTWFPMFTMIDWRYRFGARPLKEFRIELGFFRLDDDGPARWKETPLVGELRKVMAQPDLVGPLAHGSRIPLFRRLAGADGPAAAERPAAPIDVGQATQEGAGPLPPEERLTKRRLKLSDGRYLYLYHFEAAGDAAEGERVPAGAAAGEADSAPSASLYRGPAGALAAERARRRAERKAGRPTPPKGRDV